MQIMQSRSVAHGPLKKANRFQSEGNTEIFVRHILWAEGNDGHSGIRILPNRPRNQSGSSALGIAKAEGKDGREQAKHTGSRRIVRQNGQIDKPDKTLSARFASQDI